MYRQTALVLMTTIINRSLYRLHMHIKNERERYLQGLSVYVCICVFLYVYFRFDFVGFVFVPKLLYFCWHGHCDVIF